MSALTRFDPRDDLFAEGLPDLFRRFMRMPDWPATLRTPGDIRLDITESDKAYVVKAEIPGVKKDDIRVTVDGNRVSIRAEVKEEKTEKKGDGERVLLRETHYGSMERVFTLEQDVDREKAEAKFDNGVLALTLPKRAPSQGRLLSIS